MTDQDLNEQCRQIMKHFNAWIEPVDAYERRPLELFCGLLDELERDAFFKDLLQHSEVNWKYTVVGDNMTSSHIEKLNEADLGAFVALARLFTQKRERASIRSVAGIFDKRVGERHPIWWTFNAHRVGLNEILGDEGPRRSRNVRRIVRRVCLRSLHASVSTSWKRRCHPITRDFEITCSEWHRFKFLDASRGFDFQVIRARRSSFNSGRKQIVPAEQRDQ